VAPASLVTPAGQRWHWARLVRPGWAEKYPRGHGEHLADALSPRTPEYLPAGHSRQVLAPDTSAYSPGRQASQAEPPVQLL
jgi:hypothetical protein